MLRLITSYSPGLAQSVEFLAYDRMYSDFDMGTASSPISEGALDVIYGPVRQFLFGKKQVRGPYQLRHRSLPALLLF